jgi:hypothetical protein
MNGNETADNLFSLLSYFILILMVKNRVGVSTEEAFGKLNKKLGKSARICHCRTLREFFRI